MRQQGSQPPAFLAPVSAARRIRPSTDYFASADPIGVDPPAPTTPPVGTRFSTGEDLALLDGPASAPVGAVTVTPGVDGLSTITNANPAGTTFYLLAGTHVPIIGTPTAFDQVTPKDGNTYLGAPGAVLDGRFTNQYAFVGNATGVTIMFLEVINFVCPFNEFTVNHNCASNWLIQFCNMHNNGGAAIGVGIGCTIKNSWLHHNQQYAFSAFRLPSGRAELPAIRNVYVDHCEIANNGDPRDEANVDGTPTFNGRNGGCKFWDVAGVIISHNWIHHTESGSGVWCDTNNIDFEILGNLFEDNGGQAFFYEISYNFLVRSNMFRRNAISDGLRANYRTDGFPRAAVYISESGSESRIGGRYAGTSQIRNNVFLNNWDDIALWENSDRYCNSPANTSGKIWKPLTGGATLAICNNPSAKHMTVTLTNGSPIFTITGGDALEFTDDGRAVSGTGIPVGTEIKQSGEDTSYTSGFISSTSGVMTANATASGSFAMTMAAGSINVQPAYYDCRWHTQWIDIHNNLFQHNRADVLGAHNSLTGTVIPGKHSLISQYGSFPAWSPYQAFTIINTMFVQNNVWRLNTYEGNYTWMGPDTGTSNQWTFSQWTSPPRSMDAGSTYTATPPSGGGGGTWYKPDPPTNVSAVAGNTQARVFFDPPVDTGNEIITGFTATSSPGGIVAHARTGPVTVSGLTNGVAYTFTVVARTSIGDSVASSASGSVTPSGSDSLPATTIPWHPTYENAHRLSSTSAQVSFSQPYSTGGSAITQYTATSSPGGLTGTSSSSPITVSGLTPSTEYTFTITATNAVGTGPPSQATNEVTP